MPEDNRARLKQWLESGEARLHPLTLPQRELWEASPVPPGSVANHICAFIQVRGALVLKDGEAAIQRVVERQEALRTSFLPGKAQPVQLVRSSGTAVMHYRELPASEHDDDALEAAMRDIFLEPFDLLRGPLFRTAWLQRGPDEFVMVFAIHHAIADGWTLGVFVQDLVAAYLMTRHGRAAPLPAVPESYSAWGAAERAYWTPRILAERGDFWNKRLAGSGHLWAAPALVDLAQPLTRRITHVDATLATAVRNLARANGATLFSTLLTAFQWALWRWTGKDDITVGTPVANRNRKAAHETMGYYAGNVPLRVQVDPGKPFSIALREGHSSNTDAFAHYMPFAELVKALGDQDTVHHPVYSVRFALQNHPVPDVNLPGLAMKLRMRSTGTARFDLACEVTEEGDRLEVVWLHRASMFSSDDIDTLNGLFVAVLALVSGDPESRPSLINL